MAKSRVTKKVSRPTYRDAMSAMRQRARDDIDEAFSNISPVLPCSQVFDGIIACVAKQVMDRALPGYEERMAHLVAAMLVDKVTRLSCRGNA